MVPYIKDLLESLKLNFNSSEEELLKIKQIKKCLKPIFIKQFDKLLKTDLLKNIQIPEGIKTNVNSYLI